MIQPIGRRAKEIVMKDPVTYSSFPDKEMFLSYLPEMSGQDENSLIESNNNFLILLFPMGVEFAENIVQSQGILNRMERRHSKIVLSDDEMRRFSHYSFSKLIEFREHLIYLLHMAYVQKQSLFLGRDAQGMSYAKIKYDPFSTVETVRESPWYKQGKEEVFSFSKYNAGHIVTPDLGEIFAITFRE
ncbi:MAG: hypothetical protein M0Z77_01400 [Thermoplasmatales archaeon]|jgi:hypothetical protein|nr:hypothetical protein [Candidatus Thermoplasmatota archaeon]MCL6002846.1 hypothetical protein [Candidatus Thermoplasmatota archaeon]MDA8054292.1 hypothetical protein [Thermoplasmatales archaeon]